MWDFLWPQKYQPLMFISYTSIRINHKSNLVDLLDATVWIVNSFIKLNLICVTFSFNNKVIYFLRCIYLRDIYVLNII
jgi:hypothetical protein